ncbi:hypothetical protein [Bacillus sp. T3]|nr:hypothetical protein [Bacillus sp. T3]
MGNNKFEDGANVGFNAFIDLVTGEKDLLEAMDDVKTQLEEKSE